MIACATDLEGISIVTIRHIFETDAGFRFFKENVSVLLHASARFKHDAIVTNLDIFNLFKSLNRFLEVVGTYDRESQGTSTLMSAKRFPDLDEVEFYKFLPPSSLEYYRSGSFQFGPIQFYRDIENQNSRDRMEGFANIVFKAPSMCGPCHWLQVTTSGYCAVLPA